jgi:hypothetical protein
MPERVPGKERQGKLFCGLPCCGLGQRFKNFLKDSAGLVVVQQIEDQRKSGDKSQGDKNKTLYSHNTPQTKKIKGRILYQSMDQTQGKNPVAF